jgi:hypothetical protein
VVNSSSHPVRRVACIIFVAGERSGGMKYVPVGGGSLDHLHASSDAYLETSGQLRLIAAYDFTVFMIT